MTVGKFSLMDVAKIKVESKGKVQTISFDQKEQTKLKIVKKEATISK